MATKTPVSKAASGRNTSPSRENVTVESVSAAPDGAVHLKEVRGDIKSVEIADVDLLLRFADGSNLLIPNGALDALSPNPPKVYFLDQQTTAAELIKFAGKTDPVTAGNVRIITDQLDTRSVDGEVREQVDVAPSDVPITPPPAPAPAMSAKMSSLPGPNKGGGGGPGEIPDIVLTPPTVIPPQFKSGKRVENLADLQIGIPEIKGAMYVSSAFKVTPSGRSDLPEGANQPYDLSQPQNDPSLPAHQAHREAISGSGAADAINYDTSFAPAGQWAKVFHLDFANFSSLDTVTITMPNLPFGVYLDPSQATHVGTAANPAANVWTLNLTPTTVSTGVDLLLRYDLAADGNNTVSDFFMQVTVAGASGHFDFEISNLFTLSRRDATTANDFNLVGADGKPIYVLPSHGLGYDIDGGGGNDVIHAGAGNDLVKGGSGDDQLFGDAGNDTLQGGSGADQLDGGTGTNTASYADAGAGLVVALDTSIPGYVPTGDAVGDTFANIQNLTGSDYNDTLIGNSGANVISGGLGDDFLEGQGGGDTLQGDGGTNTASYAHAAAGVVASLTGGLVTASNDAAGDVYLNIQNLDGSALADILIGDGAANTLTGNGGNDVLEGMGGADVIDGAAGVDTASYAHASAAVVASLSGALSGITPSGDALGDSYVDVENLTGSDFNDALVGDGSANTLSGGAGNDVLEGLAGADALDGGAGTNTASYAHAGSGVVASLSVGLTGVVPSGDALGDTYTAIQNLTGSAHDDQLIGDSGANTLNGGLGDDTLEGMAGADSLVGGGGNDTASYAHSGTVVVASLTSGLVVSVGDSVGDTFSGITNLEGTDFADTLIGDSAANTLSGNDGDDTLEGLGGADALVGGNGTDTASYAHATSGVAVSLDTGLSGFVPLGDAVGDTFSSIENLSGSDYADTLIGDAGANSINGGQGNDVLEGLAGGDVLNGGLGVNTASYAHASAGVTATLSAGLVPTTGDAAGDSYFFIGNLTGSDYNDTLIGDVNANTINGGLGDDVLEGMGGADALVGGGGNDTASYEHSFVSVVATLTSGLSGVTVSGDALGDTYSGIANLTGSVASDTLIGDGNANVLAGNTGDDVLEGLGGADTLDGGFGSDTASYAHATSAITLALDGSLTAVGDASGDTLISIENVAGSAFNDTLVGDAGNNILSGNAGNDVLEGLAGADTLSGGSGTDTASYAHAAAGVVTSLTASIGVIATGEALGDTYASIENLQGSAFNDTLIGDAGVNTINGGLGDDVLEGLGGADALTGGGGIDLASYAHAAAGVVATLTTGLSGITASGDAAGDSYSGIAGLAGSSYADTLVGDGNANTLSGDVGDDVLEGLAGADILDGGTGSDTASYAHAAGAVVVSLDGSLVATGDAAGDTFTSIENITGSALADTLTGNTAINILDGGSGDDLLEGGGGADVLIGGAGTDTATYANATAGVVATLTAALVASAGDAAGDTFSAVENVTGSTFADTLIGNASANVIVGNGGADEIEGMGGADTLTAASGSTVSYAYASAAVVMTLDGSLVATGDAAGDIISGFGNLRGSAYNDTLRGDSNDNVLWGGAGNDTINGNAGNDTIYGEDGNDAIYGGLGADTVDAGNDDDTVFLSGGSDILDGGAGTDTLNAANLAGEGYRVSSYNLANGTLTYVLLSTGASVGGGTATNFENVTGVAAYQETFYAGPTNNVINGVGGNDWLSYYYSYLYSGAIAPVNPATSSTKNDGVLIDMVAGTVNSLNATYAGAGGVDTFSNIGNIYGSRWGDDILLGNTANNWIGGYRGQDYINGAGGTDTWVMENETSPLNGAAYILGSLTPLAGINDQAAAAAFGLSATYSSQISTTTSATLGWNLAALPNITWGASNDFLANIENVYGTGNSDWIIGNAGVNDLQGNGGSDVLEGLGGGDTINGGGSTGDTATYEHATAAVIASLTTLAVGAPGGNTVNGVTFTNSGGYVLMTGAAAGDANGDRLAGIYNLTGSDYNDTLIGNGNINVLTGGSGDDVLEGFGGTSDTLVGGAGIDYASYLHSTNTAGLTISLLNPLVNSGDGVGDNYSSIEGLIGSAYNDTLTGDNGDNYLIANLGHDTVQGLNGNDTITVSNAAANLPTAVDGGSGTDTVVVGGLVAGTSASNNLTSLAALLNNVEALNVRDGLNSNLTLSASLVQSIVDQGASSQLTVYANLSGDTLAISDPYYTATAVAGGTDYTIYSDAAKTIQVAQVHWQLA